MTDRDPEGRIKEPFVPYTTQDEFHAAIARVYLTAQDVLIRKHQDYGPRNISQAPGGALNGLQVRMHDKLARISHLLATSPDAQTGGRGPQFESLRDSFLDLGNYAMIGLLVIDGEWPE